MWQDSGMDKFSTVLAVIAAILAFFVTWIGVYRIHPEGITLILGWIPGVVLGGISGFITYWAWWVPLAVIAALYVLATFGVSL